jgi:hypothetical protein
MAAAMATTTTSGNGNGNGNGSRSVFDLSFEDRRGLVARLLANVEIEDSGCWRWLGTRNRKGYGRFGMNGEWKAHRVMWELYNEQRIPQGLHVLHSCNRPECIQPAHLRTGCNQDNVDDKVASGRQPRGEDNGQATITEMEAGEILFLYQEGQLSQRAIGNVYGVSQSCVRRIGTRRTWLHIEPREPVLQLPAAVGIVRRI